MSKKKPPRHKRVQHPDIDLRWGSDYLEHHVRMLCDTLLLIRQNKDRHEQLGAAWNAVVDSFLVHARLLAEFLTKEDDRDNDILAVDYFWDSPDNYTPKFDPWLADFCEKIGTRVAHITTEPMYARLPEKDDDETRLLISEMVWNMGQAAELIKERLMEFLKEVSESRLHMEEDISDKTRILAHLDRMNPPPADVPPSD